MRFRRDAPVALVAAIVVVVSGAAFATHRLFAHLTSAMEKSQFDLMRAILSFNLRGAENRALARAEMIAVLPTARAAVAARDRPRLLAEYTEMFQVQKARHGVDQAQFHVPPATSLLRLQNPDLHSDDLTNFRPLVVQVNREKVARKGFSIARTGPGIFGVVPMFDATGQHIGSFEFGMDFGPVLDGLKSAYGLDSALFVEEEPLRRFATGLAGDVMGDHNRLGRFIRVHSTNTALMKELVSASDLAAGTDGQYVREAMHTPYGVILVALRNASGVPIALVALTSDFSPSRSAAARNAVWQGLFTVFAIVLLAGVVLVVLRGFVLRPLQELDDAFAALAAGDRERRVSHEGLCAEMAALARRHEELRTASRTTREERP